MKTLIVTPKDGIQCLREENPFSVPPLPIVVGENFPVEETDWDRFEQSVQYRPITFTAEDGTKYREDEVALINQFRDRVLNTDWETESNDEEFKEIKAIKSVFETCQAYTLITPSPSGKIGEGGETKQTLPEQVKELQIAVSELAKLVHQLAIAIRKYAEHHETKKLD